MKALALFALLLAASLAGCSGSKEPAPSIQPGHDDLALAPPAPVLTLNVTIGNATYRFTSEDLASTRPAARSSSGTVTVSSSATASGAGNGTGNATAGAGGNGTAMPEGPAPLNVTFELGASRLTNKSGLRWHLAASPMANSTGNATGDPSSAARAGMSLPATVASTYNETGTYRVAYSLHLGNTTAQTLEVTLIVSNGTANVTLGRTLPAVTHFEFGESWGCDGSSGTPACLDFLAGPPGSDIDGHWIALGEGYWGLMLTSTVDQVQLHDSDCVFTDADVAIIGSANNSDQPCTGVVPEGAAWVFVYPYGVGALSLTVDFALA